VTTRKKTPTPPPRQGASTHRPRVALVVKRTAYETHVEQRKDARMMQLLSQGDETVAKLRAAHDAHVATLDEVERALASAGVEVVRFGLPNSNLCDGDTSLVITVGGDGTLLRASHHVAGVPILGVNSAPKHSVGFFCGAQKGTVSKAVAQALEGSLGKVVLTRMRVTVAGREVANRVLNDCLFCHASPAATSRYLIELGRTREEHKSSGLWIGPAAGSTAAQRSAGGRVLPLTSKRLQLVVREPYTPKGESYSLRRALVEPGEVLRVKSKMQEARLFPDGADAIAVSFGDELTFTQSAEPLTLLGLSASRRWG
jgi:NAD+ kinase